MSEDHNDKLTLLNGGNTPNVAQDALRELKAGLKSQIELQAVVAQIQKAKFDALIEHGFTEAQALELSKSIMI